MYLRLALKAGMPIDDWLAMHTSTQLAEISALDRISPVDDARRFEIAIARLCVAMYYMHGGQDDRNLNDYMIDWAAEYKEDERLKAVAQQIESAIQKMGLKWEEK